MTIDLNYFILICQCCSGFQGLKSGAVACLLHAPSLPFTENNANHPMAI